MDQPVNGDTLLSLYEDDPKTFNPDRWIAFYKQLDVTPSHMGLLPFRVAQLYAEITTSLQNGGADSVARALCAAGVMAHYVGDACQPLHVSQYHHGRDESEADVHEDYETRMVTSRRAEIIAGLDNPLADPDEPPNVRGHEAAADAVVWLMQRTFNRIDPIHLCDVWVQTQGHVAEMWAALGPATIACMADGCRTLAMLWSSAWAEAGTSVPAAEALERTALKDIYMDAAFAPSEYLSELAPTLPWPDLVP